VDITMDTPSFVDTVFTADAASSVAVSPVDGSKFYLYIADGRAGLSLAEATVAEPRIVTLTTPNYLEPFPAFAPLVAGTNSRAFVFSNEVPTEAPDLVTINTTAPAALGVVGTPASLDSPNVVAMVITGTSLILSAGADMIVNYPIGTGAPGTPTAVDNADALVDNAQKTVVSGDTAFVADGFGGLATVDLAAMHVTGRFTSTAASNYVNVALAGNTAFVIDQMDNPAGTAGAPTFRVYDVSGTPSELGSATTDSLCGVGISASDLVAVGTHVFLACGANGIRVVDVSTPAAPVVDATLGAATRGAALSLALDASNLYVAEGATGVEVFSYTGNGKVGPGWLTALSGAALSVSVAGNGNVYVATSEAGLEVLQSSPLVTVFLPIVVR